MTTAQRIAPTRAEDVREHHSHYVAGLYWAALLLLLLTLWIGLKHWENAALVSYAAGALFVVTLGLAIWQNALLRSLKKEPEDRQEATVIQQRRLLAFAIFGLCAALLVLMLWLLSLAGRLALPELISVVVLDVIGLGTGLALLSPPGQGLNQERLMRTLLNQRRPLVIALGILALVLLIGGGLLFYSYGLMGFPLAGGGIFTGLILIAGVLWLVLASAQEATPTGMRILTLIIGGSVGFIIALMTLVQFGLWQNQVFAGGMTHWQDAEAWRFWLAIYIELFGLALMFGSLYLAHGDIRTNAILRRLLYGYNAVFTGVLLLAILGILNVVVYASFPYTFNWTRSQGLYSLSNRSKNILEALKEPTRVYVLMAQGAEAYSDVRNLLENMQAYTNKLRVIYVSPDQNQERYRELVKQYPKVQESETPPMHPGMAQRGGRGVLIVYGPESKEHLPHSFIAQDKLIHDPRQELDPNPEKKQQPYEFRGESLIMTELSFLASDQRRPVIYFSQSNDELNIKNNAPLPQAGGDLAERLRNDNYQVRSLMWMPPPKGVAADPAVVYTQKTLKDAHKIPTDAQVIVLAWPGIPYAREVRQTIEEYMDRGGKLVVAATTVIDPAEGYVNLGLVELVGKYGVDMGNNYLMRFSGNENDVPYVVFAKAPRNSTNPIARTFEEYSFPLAQVRTVKPQAGKSGYRAETILEVSPRPGQILWAETDLNGLRNPFRYIQILLEQNKLLDKQVSEPLSVAVAVTDQKQTPRMVVFGEARNFSNSPLPSRAPYKDLFASSLEWLAERPENIGIAPRTSNIYTLRNPNTNFLRMTFLPFGLMLLMMTGLGMGVWVVRRR